MGKLSKFFSLYQSAGSLEDLNIEIQKVSRNIVIEVLDLEEMIFVSYGKREIFKNQILYDFLDEVFGKVNRRKYMNIIKAGETGSYITIKDFFDVMEKIDNSEQKSELLSMSDSESIKNIILKAYMEIRNNNFLSLLVNLKLLSEIKPEDLNENTKGSLKVLAKSLKQVIETEEYRRNFTDKKEEQFREYFNIFIKITGYEDKKNNFETDNINYESKKIIIKEQKKFDNKRETEKDEYLRYDQILDMKRAYKKSKGIVEMDDFHDMYELISETSDLLCKKKFDTAIENINKLTWINEYLVKKNSTIKNSLTVMLAETNRFFYIRRKEFKEYWGFFEGRDELKEEFIKNIEFLRELCGIKLEKYWWW